MKPAFRRTGPGEIEVHLRARVADFVVDAARTLRQAAERPGSPGFDRVYGASVDPDGPDDPSVTLSRQLMVDEMTAVVEASARKRRISLEEAEAWVKVLGMTLSSRVAELGVVTEEDRAALGRRDQAMIMLVHALQFELLAALEAEAPA